MMSACECRTDSVELKVEHRALRRASALNAAMVLIGWTARLLADSRGLRADALDMLAGARPARSPYRRSARARTLNSGRKPSASGSSRLSEPVSFLKRLGGRWEMRAVWVGEAVRCYAVPYRKCRNIVRAEPVAKARKSILSILDIHTRGRGREPTERSLPPSQFS